MDNIADRRTYGPGDVILREGDSGDAFSLIEKGSVEVGVTSTLPVGPQVLGIGLGEILDGLASAMTWPSGSEIRQ